MERKRYIVKTKHVFTGIYIITACSAAEAQEDVEKSCGFVIGGNIHSCLPDEDVDWDFDTHPETVISSVRLKKSKKRNSTK